MGEFKEREDNPLHKEYGLWNNTKYVLKKTRKYCGTVMILAVLSMICGSLASYYWGYISKMIIDLIGMEATEEVRTAALLRTVLIGCGIGAVVGIGPALENQIFYRLIHVRMMLITERVAKALSIPYEMLERPEVLDVHQRATRATDGNDNGIEGMSHHMITLGTNAVTVIVTFAAVTVLDWRLILVMTFLTILSFLFYDYTIKKDKREVWDILAPVWRKVHYMERVTQDFEFAKDIRLFGMAGFLLKKQKKIYAEREEKIDYHQELWYRYTAVSRLLHVISEILVYGVLIYAVLKKDMSVGDFTLFLSLAHAFNGSMVRFMQMFGEYKKTSLEIDDFRSFMDLEEEDESNVIPLPETENYTLEFKDVTYRYPKADKDALSHLNLTLHPGERLAVVGMNGAGKTTMIKLLLRLYDPTEGQILLNGTDIRKYSRKEYYKLFSPLFQNTEIFAFPMAENISMLPSEVTDRTKATEKAELAGLKEKLDSLPEGIGTELLKIVDEHGVDLSGGERQKLALAKALYKDAPIVVLDEPTAALDALAEKQLYERFDTMIGGKSAVYISHRLASTRFCDRVAMFVDGRMAEYGTHDELIARNGEYARMFEVQAQYYRDGEGADGDEE